MKRCARGSREFAKRHNLDWNKFVKEGIDAEELEATGDAMAIALVEMVRRREQQQ